MSRAHQHVRERSASLFAFLALGTFMVLAGTIFAVYFLPNLDLLFKEDARADLGKKVVRISIQDAILSAPNNLVARVKKQALGGNEQIDLHIPWPYRTGQAVRPPRAIGETRKFLWLSLMKTDDLLSPDRMLNQIYVHYLSAPPQKVVTGLTYYAFKPESPYGDIQIFVGKGDRGNNVHIECAGRPSSLGPLLCESRFKATDKVRVRYRFPRDSLVEWKKIDATVRALIEAMVTQR